MLQKFSSNKSDKKIQSLYRSNPRGCEAWRHTRADVGGIVTQVEWCNPMPTEECPAGRAAAAAAAEWPLCSTASRLQRCKQTDALCDTRWQKCSENVEDEDHTCFCSRKEERRSVNPCFIKTQHRIEVVVIQANKSEETWCWMIISNKTDHSFNTVHAKCC